jgi:threonine/homoserine/homoserine lactone efflux protein
MYLSLVLVATATPGPAVLFIVTNSTLYGWRKATFAALGNICGLLFLGIVAVAGLGTILKTSQMVYTIIKTIGAAYLIYLGLRLFFQKNSGFNTSQKMLNMTAASAVKIFVQAFGVAVSNPKAIVFLTALFPQFIIVDHTLTPQFTMLITTLMTFSFAFLMLYNLLAHKARIWLFRPDRTKAVSRLSGSIFIGFGVLLAASSNR